ncbi:hepatocellular carcinoma-associated antigen 59-domain-containing protein [Flagelloscypha sp. PMI_526]|nr:hepatocellular carcinoma-associated antigen 59-domain-containing protein [Flagelloscypha sp. PMI_526]
MIKKRSRPQPRIREPSPPPDDNDNAELQAQSGEASLPLADLLELRKLKKSQARQGIGIEKLNSGDGKEKKKRKREFEDDVVPGLRPGAATTDGDDEEALRNTQRKAIRTNNFTKQNGAVDVDKHMMEYIESNLTVRGKPREEPTQPPVNPFDPMVHISKKLKQPETPEKKEKAEDGSESNSMKMLTAIAEVDLGIDSRLKNIEDTEKAKQSVSMNRDTLSESNEEEAHLIANRFYQPGKPKGKTDEQILRDAKLEAMGIQVPLRANTSKTEERATDAQVMESFKKRMKR